MKCHMCISMFLKSDHSKLIKSFVCFIVCRDQPSQDELRIPNLDRNYWIGMSEELEDSEEEQTTQRTKEKGQRQTLADKTKHYVQKTKD